MADDARTEFVDGLRVTADHLAHLQKRLQESVLDLRRTVGLGKIAWGLIVTAPTDVVVERGLAFAPSGVRLAVDAPISLQLPAAAAPSRAVLRAKNTDTEALRVGNTPPLIILQTDIRVEADDGSEVGADAL